MPRLLLFGLLPVLSAPLLAGRMTVPFQFDLSDGFELYTHRMWDRVDWPGLECFSAPGEPALPALSCTFVIPPDAGDVQVSATALESASLGDGFSIQPVAVPRPLSLSDRLAEVIEPDPVIYGQDAFWPADPVVCMHDGRKSGFRLAGFRLCPFSYDPATGELLVATSIEVTVTWTDGGQVSTMSAQQIEAAGSQLQSWVCNPWDLAAYSPATGDPRDPLDFLVVTSSDYGDSFSEFVSYKNGTGVVTELVYISDILSSTPGYDDAEKLRNYIVDRFESDGLRYVLLAGDQNVLPVREVYLYCEGYSDNAPADLYFSDLDGTWDASGDHNYGEPEDDLDLYSDVAVGRALFDSASEAAIFVERSMMYESSPPPGDWQSTAMLCGGGLFPGYTGAKVCDSIAAYLPVSWDINKAYESPSILDGFTTHIDIINDGTNWVHYAGHGNTTGIYWQGYPSSMMTNSIAQGLYNGDKAGIHHSIGCHPGAFHSGECCAEALWHNAGGGAAAVMFNSSYGWEGYLPEMGVSEWMCVYLTEEAFQLGNGRIGDAFATAKDRRVPLWNGDYDRELYCIMDWCAYHDPTMWVIGGSTGVEEPESAVAGPGLPITLGIPCPNPSFSGSTIRVAAQFPGASGVLELYDLAGRVVLRTELKERGDVFIDLTGDRGAGIPSGIYLLRLACPGGEATSRLVVLPGSS
ncbi:T9SS type A sorting domain-containing protein [Candidatus Fermentibacterales bacterium]|nr:T9SS type A sorting domain-containing protein [Candidatus Fermentibacterales bacterium]